MMRKKWGNHHEHVSLVWRYVLSLKWWHVAAGANSHQRGKVVNQLLLFNLLFCSFQSVGVIHNVKPKSCNRSYVHSCIPQILGHLPNDPWTGTANDFDFCLQWLSVHVGKCSIARPWFSWGLVGWHTLPLHL